MMTSNGKLKETGENAAALPVVTHRTKYRHITKTDLSIPYEYP
jgi:hypothetical protein